MATKFSTLTEKQLNRQRRFFQWICANICVLGWAKLHRPVTIEGRENVPKDKQFIVVANHLSGADPFLIAAAVNVPVAFMAKKQLFETFWSMVLMNWCAAFAVDRDKPDISTMKTALSIAKHEKWHLAMFPQGTRCTNGKLENLSEGFAVISKKTKTDILPVSIVGANIGDAPLTIKVGKIIPYSENIEEAIDNWANAISEMTGFEYVKNTAKEPVL